MGWLGDDQRTMHQAHGDAEDYTESDDEGADGYRTIGGKEWVSCHAIYKWDMNGI